MKRIGEQKSLVDNLSRRIQELDAYAKQRLLSMDEWNERIEVEKNLENLLILENLQWKQKADRSWVLHGDANTNFFHQYARGGGKTQFPIYNLIMEKLEGSRRLLNIL
jgi:hypothetical protein